MTRRCGAYSSSLGARMALHLVAHTVRLKPGALSTNDLHGQVLVQDVHKYIRVTGPDRRDVVAAIKKGVWWCSVARTHDRVEAG